MPTKTKTTSKAKPKVAKAPCAQANLSILAKGVDPASKKLPAGTVKLSGDGLVINVQKLSKGLIRDQRARMCSSMGCISNPGGPGC